MSAVSNPVLPHIQGAGHGTTSKPDQAGIYTDAEIEPTVDAWLNRKGNNALTAALAPAKGRCKSRYTGALRDGDTAEIDVPDMFHKDVGTFVRLYDFMSQIVDHGDTDLEKRSIFSDSLSASSAPRRTPPTST